jgi:integrase
MEIGQLWLELQREERSSTISFGMLRLNFLLGGQRCRQLLRCRLDEVDLQRKTLTLYDPKGRRTTPRVHTLPLTDRATMEVAALRQIALDFKSPYLFPGKNGNPLTESPISNLVEKISDKLLADGRLKEKFCYGDIRRVVETNMASLEVRKEIRAQIQSHDQGGVQAKYYDQWEYMPQKLKALEQWGQFLYEAAILATAANKIAKQPGKK